MVLAWQGQSRTRSLAALGSDPRHSVSLLRLGAVSGAGRSTHSRGSERGGSTVRPQADLGMADSSPGKQGPEQGGSMSACGAAEVWQGGCSTAVPCLPPGARSPASP